jgi:hypothetical protein
MPTDTAVLERTLIVMAICMAIQTVMFVAAAIGGFVAWRRTTEAITAAKVAAELQIADLKEKLERVSANVEEAAHAVIRGASAVDGAVHDARESFDNVKSSVGSVAKVVAAPEAAIAMSLWRGFQFLRKRRAANRLEPAATSRLEPAATTSEL